MRRSARALFVLTVGLAPFAAWAEGSDASTVDRIITIVSSVIVPIILALVGHKLGEARTKKEEAKVRARSVFIPPPQPKTALNWLAEVGNVAAPTSQLITPSTNRRRWMPIAVTAALIGVGIITGVLVSRLVALNDRPAAVVPAAASVPAAAVVSGVTFKMFLDRGQHFVRAGSDDGLKMGATVTVLDAKGSVAAQGVVVEVWEHLARLNVEPAQPVGAVLQASFVAGAKPAASKGGAIAAPTPIVKTQRPVTPVVVAAPVAAVGLRGDATMSAVGPMKRLMLSNTGTTGWTRCELRLPNNTHYHLDSMAAGASDGISVSRFAQDGPEHDVPLTWLNIACAEGTTRINIH